MRGLQGFRRFVMRGLAAYIFAIFLAFSQSSCSEVPEEDNGNPVESAIEVDLTKGPNLARGSYNEAYARSVVVATDSNIPPYVMLDADNKLTGFDIDIINAIGKDQNFKPRFVTFNKGTKLYNSLTNYDSTVDMVIASVSMSDNFKDVLISKPYFEVSPAMLVRRDDDSIQYLKDLEGKVISVVDNPVTEEIVDGIVGVPHKLKFAKTNYFAMRDVLLGHADAYIGDKEYVFNFVEQNKKLAVKEREEKLEALREDAIVKLLAQKGVTRQMVDDGAGSLEGSAPMGTAMASAPSLFGAGDGQGLFNGMPKDFWRKYIDESEIPSIYLPPAKAKVKIIIIPGEERKIKKVMLFRKKNNYIMASVEKGLQNIKANGTYGKIYAKWFGEEEERERRQLARLEKVKSQRSLDADLFHGSGVEDDAPTEILKPDPVPPKVKKPDWREI